MAGLLIGQVAGRAGVGAATIRYYEEIGLLTPPPRSDGGYRRYGAGVLEELRFIRKAQTLGFSLEEIAEVLRLSRTGRVPCERVLELARRHLAVVEERIGQLEGFRDRLAAELDRWKDRRDITCTGLCQIIAGAEEDADLHDRRPPMRERALRPVMRR